MTDEVSPGEVGRRLDKIDANIDALRADLVTRSHALATQINAVIGPISIHGVQIANAEHELEKYGERLTDLDRQVRSVTVKAAGVSGGIGVLAFLANAIPWPWKQP